MICLFFDSISSFFLFLCSANGLDLYVPIKTTYNVHNCEWPGFSTATVGVSDVAHDLN